jgi:hypothetical protein
VEYVGENWSDRGRQNLTTCPKGHQHNVTKRGCLVNVRALIAGVESHGHQASVCIEYFHNRLAENAKTKLVQQLRPFEVIPHDCVVAKFF